MVDETGNESGFEPGAEAWVAGSGRARDAVSERVGADRLDDAGPAGDTPDDASCAVAVEAQAGLCREDRASGPFADGQVDGASGARAG